MEKEKFQQKALKQTKQKKSKSSEFLMEEEEGAATEGIENPAFNIISTDLSAYQPLEEKVIRHDKPDSTLAAHQQKLRLQAHAEPRGNEYSRNYFDPLMDEEINPRQCGMEVSEEDPVKCDEHILYGKLMKLLDEENEMQDFQARVAGEDFPDSVMPVSSSKAHDLQRELEDEVIPSYIEQFERDVQDDIILLGSFSLEQCLSFRLETEDDGKSSTNGNYWIKLKPVLLDYNYGDKFVRQCFIDSQDKAWDSERQSRL
ncbi:orofacial cleft 1 candidate gene 1 protein homolog [Heliangelus exortis]|uniref:orofacial cleft 1 candidate gene 1 protein homolog n=1 Tax=Heliangelus exortis TaxID=472823 RepID=UPI003A8DAD90